jgi:hypothetical protein
MYHPILDISDILDNASVHLGNDLACLVALVLDGECRDPYKSYRTVNLTVVFTILMAIG